jgi:hypothetical protein
MTEISNLEYEIKFTWNESIPKNTECTLTLTDYENIVDVVGKSLEEDEYTVKLKAVELDTALSKAVADVFATEEAG